MEGTQTPRGNRLHIGIFGRRNAGKSSLINALTGQETAIVSPEAGTTTDPVLKAMELHPVGPVVFIDTAGFDDEGQVGDQRVSRAQGIIDRTDIAILVMDGQAMTGSIDGNDTETMQLEGEWLQQLQAREIPTILVINKWESLDNRRQRMALASAESLHRIAVSKVDLILTSTITGEGIEQLRNALMAVAPKLTDDNEILKSLLPEGKATLLVMPQDIQAPKGRLILPQVQTIRALLDRKCTVVSTTADGFAKALGELKRPPHLIITDSQCFGQVWDQKPEESSLTSFSILMAQAKGDIDVFVDSAKAIDDLIQRSRQKSSETGKPIRILIAEACTHVPQGEDIGTVKIPGMLRKLVGETVEIENVRGSDFPSVEALRSYDLVIHCGACMFNRKHVMSRIAEAAEAGIPITNYGVFLAWFNGILDKIDL